jgi:hypothetical protein
MFIYGPAVFKNSAISSLVDDDMSEGANDPFPEVAKVFEDYSWCLFALADNELENFGEVLVLFGDELDGKGG